ncbi:diaminobutyrate--2-oxoglutarate transaminase [Micromonospora sp. HUAS LYJ1]|uniref:diaminobutyrate--2-oxoglutarate transaminase n=1 Tax=Micromonospora sp. HUAS LYJ1 TaxID=3061626 RepID=UPI002672562C|nr:diaminobutyrate--2-oxoglutarate transaminase [Micromonospora sp. HUAS LYJ1]WKU03686.1 diaminobutyrate--2-oxoglutarate transaminase [Micromonospora sp. HUAS LYJ1]
MTRSVYETVESEVRYYSRLVADELTTARNAYVQAASGTRYIDFLSGCGALNYGHNDPDMKDALLRYVAGDGIAHSLDFHSTSRRAFLEAFTEVILKPRALDYKIQFTGPTGTNAIEASLKLARKVTGRLNVIAFTNSFHGVSLGALSATSDQSKRSAAGLPLSGVTRTPYPGYFGPNVDTIAWLDRILSDPSSGIDPPAAILVEVVQGEGGLNTASPEWLRRLRALATQHGALLIVDDVQAGCGRTGTFFSFESSGIVPDMVVLAKSLSGFGLPLAVVLLLPEHDAWRAAEHNGTFRGNNHAFVTARVAILKFWSSGVFPAAIESRSRVIESTLDSLQDRTGWLRKGRGLMQGLLCPTPEAAAAAQDRCVEAGLLLERCGPHDEVLKLMPPLTIEPEVLREGLSRFADAVDLTCGDRTESRLAAAQG